MIYKYEQLTQRADYMKTLRDTKNDPKPVHFGQLKLLLSEMHFLTKYQKDAKYVLYVGAASGEHNALLAKLFPKLKFILYDPRDFSIKATEQIQIHQKFFTEEEAKKYVSMANDMLFMSDIRNLDIAKVRTDLPKLDKLLMSDQNKQKEWVQIIRPKRALLKFRLPYGKGKTKYLGGKIYLQMFSPQSAEARLLVKDYDSEVEYDNVEYDERMTYYNYYLRCKGTKDEFTVSVLKKLNLKNNNDTALFVNVVRYYLDSTDVDKVAKLCNEILDYMATVNKEKIARIRS
jgi:hypothetical protein